MIKLIALLKRKPDITPEQFAQRWLYEHTRLSHKLPGLLRYRINIATAYQPAGMNAEPLYDGTAELWWESTEAMEASFNTAIGMEAGADGDSFTTIRLHIYTDEYDVPVDGSTPQRITALT
jgi:uncharacterized protein (TIGR02118 family)